MSSDYVRTGSHSDRVNSSSFLAFGDNKELSRLISELKGGRRIISLNGLTSTAAAAFVLSETRAKIQKTFVVVVDSNKDAEQWECDLSFFQENIAAGSQVSILPAYETDPYSGISPHAETEERRALTLWRTAQQPPDFLILPAKSLVARIASPQETMLLGAHLKRNSDFPPEQLIAKLIASGYVREEPLNNIGQFSVRGGIVDVWSPNSENPVRLEFFGDTIDSIREFDADTQLSKNQLAETEILPMREFSASPQDFKDWAFFANERFAGERFARNLKDRTDFAAEGESFSGWEFLFPLVKPLTSNILEYLRDPVLVIDQPALIDQTLSVFYDNIQSRYAEISETGEIGLAPQELFIAPSKIPDLLAPLTRIELRSLGKTAAQTDEDFQFMSDSEATGLNRDMISSDAESPSSIQNPRSKIHNRQSSPPYKGGVAAASADGVVLSKEGSAGPLFLFPTAEKSADIEILSRSTRKYHGNLKDFAGEFRAKKDAGTNLFVFQTTGLAERFDEILRDYDIVLAPDSIIVGDLSGGFEIPAFGLTIRTETDLFGETTEAQAVNRKQLPTTRKSKLGAFISDFRDLKPGDFVVHVDHGIGRFEGLQNIAAQGAEREFMLLMYADNARLFVPVERLDLVSRYSSGEATSPTLDRLGGLGWQKTKARAKRAMRDMADELLKLYAERKLVTGYAFSPDAPWQHEFEDSFPYDLTVDQATAIEDVKTDMETAAPMDRLIIGDVGYGKTEVAMRAAFKAVMDGRQAAILTPTTVLAYQHFESFSRRFSAFPVKIDLLSRFRSPKEQKSVVELAQKGDVDILIGTHRILSNDVKMPKLGLVVVDEEQRFGVAHKEKLKQLKKKVDVLTLSATPIPRTLNMSLLGMRDMSVIETPPRDRLAINTQVVQFSEGVIRSAIESELSRNGQIFFIHNRVETIETVAAHIQKIVPNARIAIGHGQMNEKEMEQVMLDFIDYKYDILVATTIIENGIDIPRANTIIINRADNYGLSQLYQLRGRVGRSNRRAYAYLLIPSELELTPIARRRLSAIREFSDLGAGFRLAALDLELRGAGNILGGQQSGHLDALGFDLYTKMLERTIAEIKGDEIADETSVSINLGVDVAIPKDYISESGQRLRTYKRISSAESEEALRQIYSEIQDRYGAIPASARNLFEYARLRKSAEKMGIVSIDRAADGVAIKLGESAKVAPDRLMEFLAENEGSSFSPSGILRVPVKKDVLESARRILEQIAG